MACFNPIERSQDLSLILVKLDVTFELNLFRAVRTLEVGAIGTDIAEFGTFAGVEF
jgi:hypothetical protein